MKKKRDRRRLYCNCGHTEGWWATRNPRLGKTLTTDFQPGAAKCAKCGYVPWMFSKKADIPDWKRRVKRLAREAYSQQGRLL